MNEFHYIENINQTLLTISNLLDRDLSPRSKAHLPNTLRDLLRVKAILELNQLSLPKSYYD